MLNFYYVEVGPVAIENGTLHDSGEMTKYDGTCEFILPQIKKRKNDFFPFSVFPANSRGGRRLKGDHSGTFPPSTHFSSLYDTNEESVPAEVRYIRSLFSSAQEFIENMG